MWLLLACTHIDGVKNDPDTAKDSTAPDSQAVDSQDSQSNTDSGDTTAPVFGPCGQAAQGFVTRDGAELSLNGNTFRWVSANLPMLTVIEDDWHAPDPWEQHDSLCTIAQMGGTVARSYVISVGASYRHVMGPNQFNESLFEALDQAIAEADATGVRLIIPLVDQWDWWGGIAAYAGFRGKSSGEFWTDPQLKEDFAETITYILSRTNTVTGRPYSEEPGILAWETGNELAAPADWTAEMTALMRDIDPNHLIIDGHYGVQLESLSNDDIDIVSNHYYSPAPYGSDYSAAALADAQFVNRQKPLIIGEYGFVPTSNIQAMLDTAEAEGISGTMIWSIRSHAVDGGFYWHTEIDDGQRLYRSYHWPGFPSGEAYDETGVLDLIAEYGWATQGVRVRPLYPPEAPVILSVGDDIQWRGSAGASSYILERADTESGPWTEIAYNFDDATEAHAAHISDPNPPTTPVWYQMRAVGAGGPSDPSPAVAYTPQSTTQSWIDEIDNFDLMQSYSNLSIDNTNLNFFHNDPARANRVNAGSAYALWCPGGTITAATATVYAWPSESIPPLVMESSPDGNTWTNINFSTSNQGGDWTELLLTASGLASNTQCLRLTISDHSGEIWNPQIGRMVLSLN